MSEQILLSANRLDELIRQERCVVVDCRFDLVETERGRALWLDGHVPGAAYAHLDQDLSSPVGPATGRHPLPDDEKFARFLAAIGWSEDKLLVAYDEGPNAIAARLWWLMRYYGRKAALLDGGLAAWRAAGYELESGAPVPSPAPVPRLEADAGMVVCTGQQLVSEESALVLDARASERFSGESEPLDTRAGHIPGSVNRPFAANVLINGRFRNAAELKREFMRLLGNTEWKNVVHSCGSGVTACHNQFAMELAGLPGSRVYAGSWSEWIRDPQRPIETGP